jgi:hypothetical protein
MKRKNRWSSFLSPERSIFRYVFGTAALTVVIQALYDWFTTGKLPLGAIVLILILFIIVMVLVFYPSPGALGVDPRMKPILPHKGLILLVSPGKPDLAEKIIDHHASVLQQVWLLATPESRPVAFQIKAYCEEKIPGIRVHPIDGNLVKDADPRSTWERVNAIYAQGSLPAGDVVADITGGTKPMTAGMALACLGPDRVMEYLYTPRTKEGELPEQAHSVPTEIRTQWTQAGFPGSTKP